MSRLGAAGRGPAALSRTGSVQAGSQPAAGPSARPSAGGEPAWTDPVRLSAAGPRPAAPSRDTGGTHRAPSPLTRREHEIVMLIAQGLSNREIADELVISPATAARHVANILAKLGFSSRTQVASWATRHEPPA